MIIDCIADCHGFFPKLEGGDLLIVAGDLTARDTDKEHLDFIEYIGMMQKHENKYKKVIYIAGNHDNFLFDKKRYGKINVPEEWNIEYLCDSGTEFEGLKIWGNPWSLWFHGINPKCKAFTGTEKDLEKRYSLIPDDIDILISHGPPFGILDGIPMKECPDGSLYHTGSHSLLEAIERINPSLVIFGHIHENGSCKETIDGITYVNASIVDERYRHVNKPVRIEI